MKEQDKKLALKILNDVTNTEWKTEHRFHDVRRWRFDFACVEKKIAIEIDGGVWNYGRHNRASGYIKDLEKFNNAVILDWKVLKYISVAELVENIKQVKKLFYD
jgi:very-short-patch-repair endonuclease